MGKLQLYKQGKKQMQIEKNQKEIDENASHSSIRGLGLGVFPFSAFS